MKSRTIALRCADGVTIGPELQQAIGYAATWALHGDSGRYTGTVSIFINSHRKVSAQYHDMGGNPTFYMEGIPDQDSGEYSFHS